MSLDLGSATSATINVRINNKILQFALQATTPTWVQKPISWSPAPGSAALAITWVFGDGVSGVSTSSAGITVNSATSWTVGVPSTNTDDSFSVTKTGGGTEDPKIVITPQ